MLGAEELVREVNDMDGTAEQLQQRVRDPGLPSQVTENACPVLVSSASPAFNAGHLAPAEGTESV